jgi:hypothetical protein
MARLSSDSQLSDVLIEEDLVSIWIFQDQARGAGGGFVGFDEDRQSVGF